MQEWENLDPFVSGFIQIIKSLPSDRPTYHLHGSFADVYMQCATLKEVAMDGQQLVAIIDPKYKSLAEIALEPFCSVIYWEGSVVNNILSSMRIFSRRNGLPIRLLPTLYPYIPECMLSRRLKYFDFLRTLSQSSRQGSLPEIETVPSLVEEAMTLFKDAQLVVGKTAIFSADNNTQLELPKEFWYTVIRIVEDLGWEVCINDSGNLRSKGAKLLGNLGYKRIDISPHLVATTARIGGCYFSGTNGYATVQALFNPQCKGFHFINGFAEQDGKIPDKFGNLIEVDSLIHRYTYPVCDNSQMVEHYVDRNTTTDSLRTLISDSLFN